MKEKCENRIYYLFFFFCWIFIRCDTKWWGFRLAKRIHVGCFKRRAIKKREERERGREYFTKCRLWCMWSVFVFFGKLLCQLDRARVCSNSQEIKKKIKKKRTFVTLLPLSLPDHESWNPLSETEGLIPHVIGSFYLMLRLYSPFIRSRFLLASSFKISILSSIRYKISLSKWILWF